MRTTLALAAFGLLAATGTTALAANHEIIIGFRSDAAIADKDLIVNLGVFSSLPTTTGVITNINADLVATFGVNWNTRTDLNFGAFGGNISGTRVAYASNFGDGFTGTFSGSQIFNLSNKSGNIYQTPWDSTTGSQATIGTQGANSLVSIQDDTNDMGWTLQGGTAGAVFGTNTITRTEWEQTTDFSLVSSKSFGISSYTQGSGAWTNVAGGNTYYLDSAGNLGVTAIPEPSTYGIIGAGALAAVAAVRRRRAAARA